MKTSFNPLIIFAIYLFLPVLGSAKSIEKKAGKDTYVYSEALVANKKRTDMSTSSTFGQDFEVIKNSIIPNTVREVLGEKRIKELNEKRLIFKFGCAPSGKIEKVFFIFPSGDFFLTTDEIALLEKAFLSKTIPIKVYNKDIQELQFNQPCFFWRL